MPASRIATTLAVFTLAAGCSGSTAPDSTGNPTGDPADLAIAITTDRQEDTVSLQAEGDATVLDIVSDRGIGGADFARNGDSWPRPLILRFHLAGLEQLDVAYGDVHIVLSIASSGDRRISGKLRGADGEQPIDSTSPYWPEPTIVAGSGADDKGYIDVALPGDFFAGDHRGFAIDWVDFFR